MRIAVPIACCLVAVGCAPIAADGPVAPGRWGGIGIQLDITEQGATLDYDCAHGTIDEPLVAGADGRFSVVGVHIAEHGGPVRLEEPPDRHPARYDGQLAGASMRLTVTMVDRAQAVGTFDLTFRSPGRILKCL